ncbi:fibronectin type III domain-containing protein [Nocardioides bruguierae]|uniref:Fibronectin type III domain-containing protein n=1 Tax=Nocardioides bruguierae TaxID=2945102 RepID=A0A9X2D9L6_9ACTN|nr:fibronectin type III domain-containing protein [Nocardioides bruguierae]MCM0621822.1 fibronectin type III domain-containing protein [Nocardioides bruguierae]
MRTTSRLSSSRAWSTLLSVLTLLSLLSLVPAQAADVHAVTGVLIDGDSGLPVDGTVGLGGTTVNVGGDGAFEILAASGEYSLTINRRFSDGADSGILNLITSSFMLESDLDLGPLTIPTLYRKTFKIVDRNAVPIDNVYLAATGPGGDYLEQNPTAAPGLAYAYAYWGWEGWTRSGETTVLSPEEDLMPSGSVSARLPDGSRYSAPLASAESTAVGQYTLTLEGMDAPSPNPNLRLSVSDSVDDRLTTLRWSVQDSGDATAALEGYRVREKTTGQTWLVGSERQRLRVANLDAGTYVFMLAADSSAGAGQYVREKVQISRQIDRIRNVTARVRGRRAILRWNRPDAHGNDIKAYTYSLQPRVARKKISIIGTRMVMRGLGRGIYRFQVRASGGRGVPQSDWSKPVRFSVR